MKIVIFQSKYVHMPAVQNVLRHPLLVRMVELYHNQEHVKTLNVIPSDTQYQIKFEGDVYQSSNDIIETDLIRLQQSEPDSWICITQGTQIDYVDKDKIATILNQAKSPVVGITLDSGMNGHREQIRLTQKGTIVGVRRYYEDSVVPVPMFCVWPNLVYLKKSELSRLEGIPLDYYKFVNRCESNGLNIETYSVGGTSYQLNTTRGQIELVKYINKKDKYIQTLLETVTDYYCVNESGIGYQNEITARTIGKVWISKTANISPTSLLISPVVVSEHVIVSNKAVLESVIIMPYQKVEQQQTLSRKVISKNDIEIDESSSELWLLEKGHQSRYRKWSSWDYIHTYKRTVDIIVASIVLILFLPILPIMALAIKINSPGPVFYKARRQGLHGKEFDCIKFRTMNVGADQLQDKLRAINEVDGPQFKMADDPRISAVGKFLRETYLDEIPQFYNVLKGEMSMVGPRPSPKSENTQCPRWRDARLSVRPGVTGLWQLLRTREPLRDFQEWIYYDIEYVNSLSARMDLWICWKTFIQMMGKFIEQF